MRQTLVFEVAHGNELARIQERMLRVKDSMEEYKTKTGNLQRAARLGTFND
jgi:hypothetical protein